MNESIHVISMVRPKTRVLVLAGHNESLVNFRGALLQAITRKGYEVHVAAPDLLAESSLCALLRSWGVTPHDVPIRRAGLNPVEDLVGLFHICKLMRAVRPSVFLGYTIKPVIYGSIAARLAGVPRRFAMVEGLGFVFTPGAQPMSFKRRVLRRLVLSLYRLGLAQAEKVIFLNRDDPNELVAAGAVSSEKCFLLGGIGIELANWPALPPVLSPVTFLLVARLLREKGVEEYVAAARLVKQQHPGVRFLLLGGLDDNPGAITEAEAKQWADEGIVEWPGHVRVRPWMEQASVFVLPSYREGVPVSTQEAMASGKAVITTDAPGCRETVVDGDNGFLVPVRDVQALANAMLRFIEQPALIEQMGKRSREIAEEKYDVHKVNVVMLKAMGIVKE